MSDNKKVLYLELNRNYPYIYTNSRTVCNFMNELQIFPSCDIQGELKPCEINITDPDYYNDGNGESFIGLWYTVVEPMMVMFGVEVIHVKCRKEAEFMSNIKVEHTVEVE